MKLTTLIRGICLLLLAPLLTTCSSGGGEGGTGVAADKSIITKGAITELGSIVVNNVHYDASPTATITINGNKATDADLKIGMVATIKGTLLAANGRGSADEIIVDDVVIGAVDQTPATNTDTILHVMGQQIEINAATQLIGITNLRDDLPVDTTVSVSGLIKSDDGVIAATRIEKINITQIPNPDTFVYLVKGFMSGFREKPPLTFEIGGLTVDYKNVHFDAPGSNAVVTVMGFAKDYNNNPETKKTFLATAINFVKFSEGDADNAEIEGYITSVPNPTSCEQSGFYLNELLVCISTTTRFERGTVADIKPTTKVRVEGEYSSLGVLQATEVEFEGE